MSASRPDPSTYKPSSMINSSLEALSCVTLRLQVLRSVWFCPARAHSALGIYDAQCITLFLAGPPKWTRSSTPLFHSALSLPFAAKRKQWSILAPRQAPNKVPLLCSAPQGSERSVGTTAGGRVRWQVSCHLLSRRQPPACERRAAHTCLRNKNHTLWLLPAYLSFVLENSGSVLDLKDLLDLKNVSCIINLFSEKAVGLYV